jgi:hypothetical protein
MASFLASIASLINGRAFTYHAAPGRAGHGVVRLNSTTLDLLHSAASRRASSTLAPETGAGNSSTFRQRP